MEKIAILASGNGSNAVKVLEYFEDKNSAEVVGVLSNKANAKVLLKFLERDAEAFHFQNNEELMELLDELGVTFVVLAGYLKLIPKSLTDKFPDRIVNIHPSLLPAYGGKGMYGMNVHNAVKEANETESGITIHLVNEEFDKGRIILQQKVDVVPDDTAEEIASKVLKLEHEHFAQTIEKIILNEL